VRDPALKAVAGGTYKVVVPEPRPAHNEAQDIALDIVFEDDHLLVVTSRRARRSSGGGEFRRHPGQRPCFTIAPGASPASAAWRGRGSSTGSTRTRPGLLVVAKTDVAHEGLAAQFARHSIHRLYAAVVGGLPSPASGSVDAPLRAPQLTAKRWRWSRKIAASERCRITGWSGPCGRRL
jgi:23S rRNA pseudouridine1911/1915/1917 synthase